MVVPVNIDRNRLLSPHSQLEEKAKGAIIVKGLTGEKNSESRIPRCLSEPPGVSHALTLTDSFPQILPSSSCFIKPPHCRFLGNSLLSKLLTASSKETAKEVAIPDKSKKHFPSGVVF